MIQGLLGKKVGMTQIFDKEGNVIPVTVIKTGPCLVLELKEAPLKRVTVGFEPAKESRVRKPQLGFFRKMGVSPVRHIKEFGSTDNAGYQVGQELKVDVFKPGEYVDVAGISEGKGFQGGMKRWNWSGGPAAHGSMHHRRVGSISSSSDPSRTYVGRHMPGHMGACQVTVQGLRVMMIDAEQNLLLVRGAIPGAKRGIVVLTRSKKKAYRSLDEQKVVVVKKINPMKQSKAKVKGKK
jgi:large subunit ribosomal protein L3